MALALCATDRIWQRRFGVKQFHGYRFTVRWLAIIRYYCASTAFRFDVERRVGRTHAARGIIGADTHLHSLTERVKETIVAECSVLAHPIWIGAMGSGSALDILRFTYGNNTHLLKTPFRK